MNKRVDLLDAGLDAVDEIHLLQAGAASFYQDGQFSALIGATCCFPLLDAVGDVLDAVTNILRPAAVADQPFAALCGADLGDLIIALQGAEAGIAFEGGRLFGHLLGWFGPPADQQSFQIFFSYKIQTADFGSG